MSKRCCPACSIFLHYISPQQQPFLVRGAHSNVSACTLPPWTPSHIVDKMVAFFGDRLRKDIIALMPTDGSTPFRSRTASSGSQTLSINSNAGHNARQIFNSSKKKDSEEDQHCQLVSTGNSFNLKLISHQLLHQLTFYSRPTFFDSKFLALLVKMIQPVRIRVLPSVN